MLLLGAVLPTVAVVDGAKIQFYPDEHPPPHFHVVFAEHRAQIEIESLRILKGTLPRSKLASVISWASTRRAELMEAWSALDEKRKPGKIK
jgi:hypothetical protein